MEPFTDTKNVILNTKENENNSKEIPKNNDVFEFDLSVENEKLFWIWWGIDLDAE